MKFIRDESAEKLRGGYYTDPDIAKFLAKWAMAIAPTHILEPSCGDGVFVRAIAQLRNRESHPRISAFEIVGGEAAKARGYITGEQVGDEVFHADFLAWCVQHAHGHPQFDAVVGNPPYIRYQYLSAEAQEQAERIIRSQALRFTRHTNAWVPFVVAAISKLRPGGRLAMVIPSELLSVIHADSARSILLRECSRVFVIDPEEIWFEETLQGVVLLLAEKRGSGNIGRSHSALGIVRVSGRSFLQEPAESLMQRTTFVDAAEVPTKWTHALLSQSERNALHSVASMPSVHKFSDIASVAVGIVTGANKFFLVNDDVVNQYDLGTFAHPMFGRSEHVAGVIYDHDSHRENREVGHPANFIWFDAKDAASLPPGARRYIEQGEAESLHTRFKCRVRTPWYSVPSVFASPIGMLKRSHEFPRLILNEMQAYTTDTAYRVSPKGVEGTSLVGSFVNSLTALSAELEGRHYGGGVLELVPSEINRLVVPLANLDRTFLTRLDNHFRKGIGTEALFATQDRVVLGSVGLTKNEISAIQSAAWRMRRRRLRSPNGGDGLGTGSVTECDPAPTNGATPRQCECGNGAGHLLGCLAGPA